jgi:vancomycin resistance protein YoaR
MICPSGGRFSLNEAMGQRTEARGFVAAPQINDGELEDAVGGGVSQIATTVFNAGWFAGLRIETHTPHQFYISRYPLGREATVSWGGPELVLVNDWPAAILISAKTTDTSITVRFFSSKLGRRVTTETVELPGRGAPAARYSRTVFRGDEVHREDSYTWYYDAAPG